MCVHIWHLFHNHIHDRRYRIKINFCVFHWLLFLIADLHIFVYGRAEFSFISLEGRKVKLSILNNFVIIFIREYANLCMTLLLSFSVSLYSLKERTENDIFVFKKWQIICNWYKLIDIKKLKQYKLQKTLKRKKIFVFKQDNVDMKFKSLNWKRIDMK